MRLFFREAFWHLAVSTFCKWQDTKLSDFVSAYVILASFCFFTEQTQCELSMPSENLIQQEMILAAGDIHQFKNRGSKDTFMRRQPPLVQWGLSGEVREIRWRFFKFLTCFNMMRTKIMIKQKTENLNLAQVLVLATRLLIGTFFCKARLEGFHGFSGLICHYPNKTRGKPIKSCEKLFSFSKKFCI